MPELQETEHGKDHGLPVRVTDVDRPCLEREDNRCHEQADPDRVDAEAVGKDAFARMARRPLHQVTLFRLHGERKRREPVGKEVDPENMDRLEGEGEADKGREEEDPYLARVRREEVFDELSDIVIDTPSFFHGLYNRRKNIIKK